MTAVAESPDEGQPDLRIVFDEEQASHRTHGSGPGGRNAQVNGSLGSGGARVNHPGGMIEGMRPLLAAAGWIAAAVAAIGIGLAGVQTIGAGITDDTGNDVLSAERAARELAAAGPPPTTRSAEPTVPPASPPAGPAPSDGNERVFSGPGGTVWARCLPGGAQLISSSPAQGYGVKEYRQGPAEYAEVRFERAGGGKGKGSGDSRVRITCVGGSPVDSWR